MHPKNSCESANMESHLQQLVKHCRICGKRLCKAKGRATTFECKDYMEELLMTFGINAGSDDIHVLPSKFCKPCYAVMSRKVKASKEGVPYTHTVNPMTWTPHNTNCQVKKKKIKHRSVKYYYTLHCRYAYILRWLLGVEAKTAKNPRREGDLQGGLLRPCCSTCTG